MSTLTKEIEKNTKDVEKMVKKNAKLFATLLMQSMIKTIRKVGKSTAQQTLNKE